MMLRIHHGAAEIGGNCIELQSGTSRLLLDLGLPLQAGDHGLPSVSGLAQPDRDLLGVVLSHPHLDHYGLLPLALPTVPVWLGEGAVRLLEAAAPFTRGAILPQKIMPYRSGEPFDMGPFRITPYLMDHSAYDAHALLVEADGKRLFYSGDFRGHGRKARVFERFLANPPTDIDLLLMEGTTLGRDEPCVSETDVEDEALQVMRATSGLVLACFSGQNIDRFVSFLRASMRAGRTFIADPINPCVDHSTSETIPAAKHTFLACNDPDSGKLLSLKHRQKYLAIDQCRLVTWRSHRWIEKLDLILCINVDRLLPVPETQAHRVCKPRHRELQPNSLINGIVIATPLAQVIGSCWPDWDGQLVPAIGFPPYIG